ncbi:MAG: anaerobic ribonucleoside-triphosphate reductase activating protein [Bacilli bacterium]|nr:anaerobic ribonucleoside-triphosphate reductase activating protein [Bacilli bacterium]
MNYATIKNCDIANGKGVRVSLFVSGCTHHCKGCFNEVAWDFSYGEKFDEEVETYLISLLAPSYIQGLTLLGGEPFEVENQKALLPFIRKVKEIYPTKNIWAYTGYLFEKDLLNPSSRAHSEDTEELLSYIDVLVDGPFILEQKDIALKFRGSENQRIIDVKNSLRTNQTILIDELMK